MTTIKLEKMLEYEAGQWYSPFVKIYSIGGPHRIAELSTYPRAYKDTSSHLYEKDEEFTVTETDLNWRMEDGESVYRDRKDGIFRVGEEAVHLKGDNLPGIFPLWIEDKGLPFSIPDADEHIFPIDKMPKPIVKIVDGQIKLPNGKFVNLPQQALNHMRKGAHTDKIKHIRRPKDDVKQIIRFKYQRRF